MKAIIDTKIFKAYDIRGIYPTQINEEVMEDIVRGIVTFLQKRLGKTSIAIAIGHDMRLSSPALHKIAVETLIKSGTHVIDLGLVATPTVYFAVKNKEYDAGIQISASHNPKEYNGIKIVLRDGEHLVKIGKNTGMNEIVSIVASKHFTPYEAEGTKDKYPQALQDELTAAMTAINAGDVSGISAVVDPANAMGILPVGELFKKCEAKLITMNFTLDGTFPAHQADPLQHKTLVGLQKRVIEERADLGIAIDGDADRAMFIDEKGAIVPATLITTLIAGEILKESPQARVLVDIRYIRNVEDMVKKMGGEVGYTKVGHALITEQVNTEGAQFAGESSGHYYFQSMGGCESTVRVLLYVLKVLAREKRPFSEILAGITTSVESGEFNFVLPLEVKSSDLLEILTKEHADGELSRLDGIAITYPEWRFSVRTSNTEPLLRLNVEGKTRQVVDTHVTRLKSVLQKYKAVLQD